MTSTTGKPRRLSTTRLPRGNRIGGWDSQMIRGRGALWQRPAGTLKRDTGNYKVILECRFSEITEQWSWRVRTTAGVIVKGTACCLLDAQSECVRAARKAGVK